MTHPRDETDRLGSLLAKLHAGVIEAIELEVARRRAAGLPVYVSGPDGQGADMAALRLAMPPSNHLQGVSTRDVKHEV